MTGPQSPEPSFGDDQPDGQDDGVIAAIDAALAELDAVRDKPVQEHVKHFEVVHTALTDALSTADTYVSGMSGNRS